MYEGPLAGKSSALTLKNIVIITCDISHLRSIPPALFSSSAHSIYSML